MNAPAGPRAAAPLGAHGLVAWLAPLALLLMLAPSSCAPKVDVALPIARGPDLVAKDPNPLRILQVPKVAASTPIHLQASLASDDAGRGLDWVVFLDYASSATPKELDSQDNAPPGTFDQPRTIETTITLDDSLPLGCHSLTLLVTYGFTAAIHNHGVAPNAPTAQVTWWIDLYDGMSSDPVHATIDMCPGSAPGKIVDAGGA